MATSAIVKTMSQRECCKHCLAYILIFLVVTNTIRLIDTKQEITLYDESDPMIQLNNDTIYKELEGSKRHWVVEFYSSWCGHCQQFAPEWKTLAWEVKNWKNYVNIGAINCAEEKNFDICVTFGINQYPTIKFYKPNWKKPVKKQEDDSDKGEVRDFRKRRKIKEDDTMGIVYNGDKKINLIKRSLIDVIEKDPQDLIPTKSFDFASYNDIEEVTAAPSTYLYLFILFESPGSYIGKNLILDTSSSKITIVRRVNFINEPLKEQYGVSKNPSLVYVNLLNKKSQILKSKEGTYISFVDALNSVVKAIEREPEKSKNTETEKTPTKLKPQLESEVNQMDILSAVSYSLKREVPKNDLDSEDIVALQHWVTMLTKCLPGRKPFKTFLRNLNKDLLSLPDHQLTLTKHNYNEILQKALKNADYTLVEEEWRSCKGSESKYRGFPCSLWTVFHTLTVNCAELDSPDISGLNVMVGIRDFVSNFFGCEYCRNHFKEMAKTIRSEVLSHNDAIIWLWKSHNKVNARLRKDASADPVHPKIQFPPESMCAECRSDTTKGSTFITDPGFGIEKTSWNRRVVLEFLKEHYSPDNIRVKDKSLSSSPDVDDDIESVRRNPHRFTYRSYPRKASMSSLSFVGMSYFDTSLCVFLYVLVIASLIILYLYFMRFRRRKQHKHFV